MSELAKFELGEVNGIPLARVVGEIDTSNAEKLLKTILGGVSNQAAGLVLDLTHTTYLDSSGIHVLFEASTRLTASGQQLRIALPADSLILDVLKVTGLVDVIPVEETVEDAAQALK